MQEVVKHNNSYVWLDWVRTIGIYCVVLAHLALPVLGKNWIYSFHMPLFFFISGFLFKPTRGESLRLFIRDKLKKLLLPYLLFNILTYVIWIVKIQIEPDEKVNILDAFFQMFYGGILPHNTPLWFLMALFLVEIVSYIPLSRNKGRWMLIVFLMLSWITIYIGWVPLYIDAAVVGVQFYVMANISKDWILRFLKNNTLFIIGLLVLLIIITCLISQWNGRVDMLSNNFGYNFLLFEIGAITGIGVIFILGEICERFLGELYVVKYISRNTLVVLALHITVIRFFKGSFMIMHINSSIWNNIYFNILFSVVVIIVLLPVVFFIKRYVPWIIGK